MGEKISMARRWRRFSQQSMAERMGASLNTVRRMEEGSPTIALHYFVRALQIFGELDQFEALLDTPNDYIGLVIMDETLPQRIRKKRNPGPVGF